DDLIRQGTTYDSFGVSLLDPMSLNSLVPTVDNFTDCYFIEDVVPGAQGLASSGVSSVPGTDPGSLRITLNVDGLGGTGARLLFPFLGGSDPFHPNGSFSIPDVVISGNTPVTTPTVTVIAGSFAYDGQEHPAAGFVTGVGGANLGTPTFTYTDATNVTTTNPP